MCFESLVLRCVFTVSKRLFVLCVSFLECGFREYDVVFSRKVFVGSDLRVVDDAGCETVIVEWAFVLLLIINIYFWIYILPIWVYQNCCICIDLLFVLVMKLRIANCKVLAIILMHIRCFTNYF